MEPREIHEGEEILVQGSAKEPYRIRMIDGLVSCSCRAWCVMGGRVRICKHIRAAVLLSSIRVLEGSEKIDWDSLPPTTTDSGLYRIVCTNGNFYIGETASFKHRWSEHRSNLRKEKHPNKHLQSDYNRFGAEAFSFHSCLDIENNVARRATEIRTIRSHLGPDCYNKSEYGAPSTLGTKATEETRAKIAAASRGRVKSPKSRIKASVSMQAHWAEMSAEDRERIGAARTGEKRPEVARARMRAAAQARWARPDSAEHRAQTSARCKGKTLSADHRAKIGAMARLPESRARSRAAAEAQAQERTAFGTFSPRKDKI